jgi:hypothetical protein
MSLSSFDRDDDVFLFELNTRVENPREGAQRVFRLTWDAVALVHQESEGIEILLEHDKVTPLEDYAAAFDEIGMPEAAEILRRLFELMPLDLRGPENQQDLRDFLRGRYQDLSDLAGEFCGACIAYIPRAVRYVREHWSEFDNNSNHIS